MRLAPCLAATLVLSSAGCRGPAKREATNPPDAAATVKPRHAEAVAFECDCACEAEGCACRPLRSGACVCLDPEGRDCPCTCEGREVTSISEISGKRTEPSPATSPPVRPPPDHVLPPPPGLVE